MKGNAVKSFKNLKVYFGNNSTYQRKNIHKYSIYMQSKDSEWLNRNIKDGQPDDYPEPIEEDIRD